MNLNLGDCQISLTLSSFSYWPALKNSSTVEYKVGRQMQCFKSNCCECLFGESVNLINNLVGTSAEKSVKTVYKVVNCYFVDISSFIRTY